ncbi:MAG: aspartate aminotransferase family protein [Spirochaetales bacterium]|nr:aspartate aminotransferase family protein [Spirochaetales bacterium]
MDISKAMIKNPPLPKNFAPELLVIEKGEGAYLFDSAGNKYLDFGAGIAVNALGYNREDLIQAGYNQMKKLIHISNLYATKPQVELAGKLISSGNFGAVHFGNSGSEANEAAIKYARLYSLRIKGPGHHKLLCFTNAFHGRTLGALSCTPSPKYQDPFGPLIPGVVVSDFNNTEQLSEILDDSFAAVIVEVIQGEGGLALMTDSFAEELNTLCKKYDIILIVDEIQTGLSRTGTLYASEGVGLHPDIITLAKPLAGGLPLSATLIPEKINNLLHVGEHGTTFGGGPVTTAMGLVVWKILSNPAFIKEVSEKGKLLASLLEELSKSFDFTGNVKGKGLLRGIEIEGTDEKLMKIIRAAMEKGILILRSGKKVIRIAPPLIISVEEIEKGCEILKQVFADYK